MKILPKYYIVLVLAFSITISNLYANNVKIGDTISNFIANDENGKLWDLQNNLDQKFLVIYFYPAALTGG